MGSLPKGFLETSYVGKKWSVSQIAEFLKCSQHKVNYWLKEYRIPKHSIADAIYLKNNPNGDPFVLKEINSIADAKLLGLGLGLYWGEGNKKNKASIRLGNTNGKLIREFIRFLLVILGVKAKKLQFGLQVFSDIIPTVVLKYWLSALKEFR